MKVVGFLKVTELSILYCVLLQRVIVFVKVTYNVYTYTGTLSVAISSKYQS